VVTGIHFANHVSVFIYAPQAIYQYQFINYAPEANLCAEDITLRPYHLKDLV
jgi:hypothetical protein